MEELREEQFTTPTTPAQWREVERKFSARWNFPHCCGAVDGKHVEIKKPKQSGSLYYCFKGFFSIVLMAMVDADYKFLWIQTGGKGSQSDGELYNIHLKRKLENGHVGLPPPEPLPHDDRDTDFFLVGDDAFPLREFMVKPYAAKYLNYEERVFNYRCSRARRVVENGFGILAGRWRVLHRPMQVTPTNARKVIRATVALHNVLRDKYPNIPRDYLDHEAEDGHIVPGAWRQDGVLQAVEEAGRRGPRETRKGKEQREYLKAYYCSDVGSVPWQDAAVQSNTY